MDGEIFEVDVDGTVVEMVVDGETVVVDVDGTLVVMVVDGEIVVVDDSIVLEACCCIVGTVKSGITTSIVVWPRLIKSSFASLINTIAICTIFIASC